RCFFRPASSSLLPRAKSAVQIGSRADSRSETHRISSFVSISLQVLLSERSLSAVDEAADIVGIQCERSGNLLVGEILAAQEQEFCVARLQNSEHGSHALLFYARSVQMLWCRWRIAVQSEQPFEPASARLAPPFVQCFTRRGPVQPSL